MSFELKRFSDGEESFAIPEWYRQIEKIEESFSRDLSEKLVETEYRPDEVGLKHPTNGSYIRIKEDGTIEAFTQYGTGIRIGSNNTLQLFGDKIYQISRDNSIESNPNSMSRNSESYFESYPKRRGLSGLIVNELTAQGRNTYRMEEWK